MSDPVVLITGALTGIGRATALAYARQGANLVVSGRHQEMGEQFARELSDLGAQAEFVRADVRFEADVKNLVDRAVARFGRIDVAVNNAGTAGTPGPVTHVTDDDYQATFDTNVKGTLLCLKHEFRVMREQGGGSIVNVSSVYGLMGYPEATLYVGSKHAVVGFTKAAALEGAATVSGSTPSRPASPGPLCTSSSPATTRRVTRSTPCCPCTGQAPPRRSPRPSSTWVPTKQATSTAMC